MKACEFVCNADLVQEGVVAPWCNPLTLQPEQSGGVGSSPGKAPPLERHDKGSRTRLGLLYSAIPALGAEKRNFTFTFTSAGLARCSLP